MTTIEEFKNLKQGDLIVYRKDFFLVAEDVKLRELPLQPNDPQHYVVYVKKAFGNWWDGHKQFFVEWHAKRKDFRIFPRKRNLYGNV